MLYDHPNHMTITVEVTVIPVMPTTTINLNFNLNTSLSTCKQRPTIFPHDICTEDVTKRNSIVTVFINLMLERKKYA
jgi:hypothetical protein